MAEVSIRVLLIEDNPADILLLQAALEADRLVRFTLTSTSYLSEGLECVAGEAFDLVLLDLGLPDSSGLETFERFQIRVPDLPVVILSGNVDEETAIRAVRAGAQDYLVKGPAGFEMAPRTLRYALERHASERRFRTVFHASPTPQAISLQADGLIRDVNQAYCQMLGYTRDELVGHSTCELNLWANLADRDKMTAQLQAAGHVREMEINYRVCSGEIRILLVSVEPIELNGEKCLLSSAIDITERKRAEQELLESEARFATAFFTNPVSQSILSLVTGLIMEVNEACCGLFGYTRTELIGVDPGQLNLWANPAEQLAILDELQRSGHLLPAEIAIRQKSGESRTVLFAAEPITWRGTPCLITSSLDITERKQADLAIQMSERRFATIFNSSPISIVITRLSDNQMVEVNPGWLKLFGYTREEIIGKRALDLGLYADPQQRYALLEKLKTQGHVSDFEVLVCPKHTEMRIISISAEQIDFNDEPCALMQITDITERKQAEKKLRESETRLRQVLESTQEAIFAIDQDYRLLINNQRHQQVLVASGGHPFEIGEGVLSPSYPPDVCDFWRAAYDRALAGEAFQLELAWTDINGQPRVYENSFAPLRDAEDRIFGVLVVAHNITERKQAEEKLRESEKRFATLFHSNPIPVGIVRAKDFHIVDVNEAWSWLTGYSREEALERTSTELGLAKPETLRQIRAMLDARGEVREFEIPFFTRLGQERLVLISSEVLKLDGEIYLLNNLLDITERKQAEEKLHESEQFLKESQRIAKMGSWRLNLATYKLDWSENCYRLYGFEPNEIEPTFELFRHAVHPDDLQLVDDNSNSLLQSPRPFEYEYRIFDKNGHMKWIYNSLKPIMEGDQVVQFTGIQIDITARKQAEEQLRESEARARAMLNAIPDLMFRLDRQGTFLDYKADVQDLHEQTVSLVGQRNREVAPPEFAHLIERKIEAALVTGQLQTFEYQLPVPGRGSLDFEARMVPSGADEVIAIVRNITEQKRNEALIFAQRDLARSISRVSTLEEGFRLCLETALRLSGLDSGGIYLFEPTGARLELICHQGLGEAFVQAVLNFPLESPNARLVLQGASLYFSVDDPINQTELSRQEGLLALAVVPIHYQARVIGCMNLGSHVLTSIPEQFRLTLDAVSVEIGNFAEYLRSQAALRQSEKRFATIFENTPLTIGVARQSDGRFIDINPAFTRLLGYTREEVLGRTSLELNLWREPADRRAIIDRLNRGKHVQNFESVLRAKSGAQCAVLISGELIDINDEPCLMLQLTDITERKQAELEIEQANQRFSQIAGNIPEAFWVFDNIEQRLSYISPAYETIWGRSPQSLYENDRLYIEAILPEDRPIMFAALERQAQGEPTEMEYRILRPDNVLRWIQDRSFPILDETGQVVRTIGIATDISTRKQAEDEAIYRQQLLEKVLLLGKNITAISDLDACLREVQHSVTRGLGFDRVGVFLYDDSARQIRGAYGTSRSGELEENGWYVQPVDARPEWQEALLSPTGLFICDDYQALYNPPPESEMYGVRQHATLAAWAGDRPVALLTVDNLFSKRLMHPADLESLQLFAGYAGLAVANARLHASLEARIRERTAEVQDLYDHAPAGYHSLDAAGQILQINQTELEWVGYSREELIGQPFARLFTPTSLATFQANFPTFKQRGWVHNLEFDLVRKDGSTFPVLVNATAIKDDTGNYLMSRSTVFDNSERKKAEEALRASQASLQDFLDTASDLIQSLDEQGNYIYVNTAWCNTLGYTSAEALRLNMLDVVDPEHQALCRATLQKLIQDQRAEMIEVIFKTKQGQPVIVEGQVSSRKGENGQSITSGIFRDITQRKLAEDALRQSRDELSEAYAALEKASRAKDDFLANMSHELRTPLSSILGLAEILLEEIRGPLNASQRKLISTIQGSGSHLLSLINDVLDLSKIEAEKLEINFERLVVADLCQASLVFIKETAIKKNIKVTFDADPAVTTLQADARRLKQILVNLLSNAVKFTPTGGQVTLAVRADLEQNLIHFAVRDNGIGIAPEDLERLFQPFTQVDTSLTRRYEGTGLGLALVKRLTELHGGHLAVESTPGLGSCFTVSLPWQPHLPPETLSVPAASLEPASSGPSGSVRAGLGPILFADDNEANIMTIGDYLEAKGYRMLYARNGREALEQAVAATPNLILMDIQMPEIDGLEVIRRLRANPRFASLPIIALTALAMDGDRERCLEAGATTYLSKPVRLRELAELVGQLLEAAA